jgi:hypothetical protein
MPRRHGGRKETRPIAELREQILRSLERFARLRGLSPGAGRGPSPAAAASRSARDLALRMQEGGLWL